MSRDNEFVNAIFDELFNKNFEQYARSLNKAINSDTDSYAKARNALSKLNESERADVLSFFKVVIADSASVILGTLDGVHFPDNVSGDFSLSYEGEEIQGDLQDLFIEKAQDLNVYG
ncbi:hypothetical protein ABEH28_03400 [Pseudomonas sp. Ps21-P2]|uniref:hypothetical protein n=1 Tax=Pseudomonas sp. Ps21-P2 TaxID=3080331 RepID=UPI003208D7A1